MSLTAVEAASFMARALHLAEAGLYTTHPNPRVGCVIVQNGVIVGEGAHLCAGEPHAEVFALREAGARAKGAEIFVTLEPCAHHGRTPPCVDAVIAAAPARVWVAMLDPNPLVAGRGITRLRDAGIAVELDLMNGAATTLNRGFVSRMTRARPWVTVKLAASLDGRTAMASGESRWITGAAARADVHRLRATAGAVLTGVGTILADDPQLTARDLPFDLRQPDRIVVDSAARTPLDAAVWREGARRFWLTQQVPARCPHGVESLCVAADAEGRLQLPEALRLLASHGVNEVLVEAGSRLAGALLQAKLVDEVIAYMAPMLLGDAAQPLARLPGLDRLADRIALQFTDVRMVGSDLRLTARPQTVAQGVS